MNVIMQVMKEQLLHRSLIFRLSFYEVKSTYKMHYLGAFWQILSPLFQIGVYWLVFGLGIRGGAPVGDTPFFLWLLAGLVPWLFISPTVIQGSNSVYSKINVVSKMKFPVSILPSITIVVNSFSFIVMLGILIILLLCSGVFPGWYLLQLPYYLVCLYFLLLGMTLLFSTLTTIIRDVQSMIQSIMRLMMYLLPILWNVENLPTIALNILKLNPFFYIIDGFRNSLLGGEWFFQNSAYTLYFWCISLLIMLVGCNIHLKFRHKFVDYI